MDADAETVLAWVRTWGVEAVLAVVAVAGLAVGATGGGPLTLVLGVVLAAATADRVRLRLDNRSLAEAVAAASETRVSAARRETAADAGLSSADENEPSEATEAPPEADR
jgi:hypothetical protein